jgi:hypothetical protein
LDAKNDFEELKKQAAAAEVDLQAKQTQLHELNTQNGHLESTLASIHKKVEELQTNYREALAVLVLAQSASEEEDKLQQENEILMNEVTQFHTKLDEQFNKPTRKCVILEENINSRDSSIDSAQYVMGRSRSQFKKVQETFEQQIRERDSEVEALCQQARDANVALSIAQETIAQLEKEKTCDLPKLSILQTGPEDDNDDELSCRAAGSTHCSQQGSLQQQARPHSTSESFFDTTTTGENNGEHSPVPMTESVSSGGELNIPNRKRREYWHKYWSMRNSKRVFRDDVVHKMELPCFDASFSDIGIARPAENHEDRTLESGKVLEHTKCNHCLQWYTKKDMYDHLKTCKAFWDVAIRCGYCKGIFKYNTAFFNQHIPGCKAHSTEEGPSEKHYTLTDLGTDVNTTQISQQVGLGSNAPMPLGQQVNPDAPIFTPRGSTSGLESPVPTGPRYLNPNSQQVRGMSFNGPQFARSPQSLPYITPRGIPPAHGVGFGTPSLVARTPTGPKAYSAPRDNSQASGSRGQQQQDHPQTPEKSFPFSPGYTGRK